jgi:pimeloyl-ACP methyl ester carboxylesterase
MHHRNRRPTEVSAPVRALLVTLLLASMPVRAASDSPVLNESACTAASLGAAIKASQIGEPVAGVVFDSLTWVAGTGNTPAHCMVNGRLEPVDKSATARPIRFGVALPAEWNRRAVQMGGGGMNGSVPGLAGGFGGASNLSQGFATYGSDSGHANGDSQWALNDEAIRNLGYLQLKKTHDVAMVLIERAYGARPQYNYFVGSSQGGREALTVAQRYPADYDGIAANVPIVGFSTLMLAPELIRIKEKPLANWVTAAKVNAIRGEFMRQCDTLDGLADGIINAYVDCRAIFNVNDGSGEPTPWGARRCPNDVDPDPQDATQNACLTSGQIQTLQVFFSSRRSEVTLANGRTHFGMWAPTSSSALLVAQRFRGQEGAAVDAPFFSNQGTLGVVGFVMQDLAANPLDLDVNRVRARRQLVSEWLDSTDPDLGAFHKRGGKLLVTIGTDDTTAPSGEQLDFYQSVLDTMGRETVDAFARLYVIPQGGHGLSGRSATINGDGAQVDAIQVPSNVDRFALLRNWVEKGIAPGRSEVASAGARSMPMCSYPEFPRYQGGDTGQAGSYACTAPQSKP